MNTLLENIDVGVVSSPSPHPSDTALSTAPSSAPSTAPSTAPPSTAPSSAPSSAPGSCSSSDTDVDVPAPASTHPVNTMCNFCHQTLTNPKVLWCFHTFCKGCLESNLESAEKALCPTCQSETYLGAAGVMGLLPDFAVDNVLSQDKPAAEPAAKPFCTGCNSGGPVEAKAKCFDCSHYLCTNCLSAHRSMHCFAGHRCIPLEDLQNNMNESPNVQKTVPCTKHKTEVLRYFCKTCDVPICTQCSLMEHSRGHEYEYLNESCVREMGLLQQLADQARAKTTDLRTSTKNIDQYHQNMQSQYNTAQKTIHETYKFYVSTLDDRKIEALKELDAAYNSKQVHMSTITDKLQESIEKLCQGSDFIDKLIKYSSDTEMLLFKKMLDSRLNNIMAYTPEVNLQNNMEIQYVSNYQAIQAGVRNTFGYVRHSQEVEQAKPTPISRPNSLSGTGNYMNGMNGATAAAMGAPPSFLNSTGSGMSLFNSDMLSNGFSNGVNQHNGLAQLTGSGSNLFDPPSSLLSSSRFPSNSSLSTMNSITDSLFSNSNAGNPYERWSSGGLDLFPNNGLGGQNNGLGGPNNGLGGPNNGLGGPSNGLSGPNNGLSASGGDVFSTAADPVVDMTSRMIAANIYPPKSQIKRHKMIYHCKFGEFGVAEGQFTEPSGVAVNAQNDIIVADTNNHRIQIFDREGRFKFQFGECGKRDSQLLYPNRVAVVKSSGDIVVTERSPTHQVQVYNQYGQFVRKFGANILQHPRGVAIDNKGRIVLVECKVMRVIIFDQMGTILNKFSCSKNLEFPNGVVVNDNEEIFISDNRAHCVKVFNYQGVYLRQIGGEGITNYPIGVGINQAGEILIADNHNNFNLTIFTQSGEMINALESKVKHAQCFDVALMDEGSIVLASKDYRLYVYRYAQAPAPPSFGGF